MRSVLSFYTQNLWFWFPLRFSAIFFGLRFLVFMSKRGVLLVFDLDLNPRRLFFSFFFFNFLFLFLFFVLYLIFLVLFTKFSQFLIGHNVSLLEMINEL